LDCDKRRYPSFYNIKSIAYLILGNLVYNIEIKIVNVDDKPVPTLSYRFFKNRNIKNISAKEYPYDTNILSGYNLDNGEVPKNKRIVLLDDQCNISSSHSRMELSIILRKLKEIIKSNFSQDQVLFKRHPNPEFYSKEFDSIYSPFSEYPYYIPADFIFLHPNIRFVIGGFSTTLATASKYDNIRSISYIKLVPFNNEDYRNQIIKFLKSESEDKIFFPDSWDELNLLLKSISL
jgi:hypothetical protein